MHEDPIVSLFREYLCIKTVHPNPDYGNATKFLLRLADEVGLKHSVIEIVSGKPIVLMSWIGTQPGLTSLVLNSHTDVVPVYPEEWKYDPFAAFKDEKGNIYGRGSQDMKCVGIQYIEAVRRLKKAGKSFERTIHLLFVPDEEITGIDGMMKFVETEEFSKLNVGFVLDEGLANETDAYKVYYGERSVWHIKVTCKGNPGHGSRFITNTAAEKMNRFISSVLKFRAEEENRLNSDPSLRLGDVTSANVTEVHGGVQINVVPSNFIVSLDIRVAPTADFAKLANLLNQWCAEAGEGVTFEWLAKTADQSITELKNNPWWEVFSATCKQLDLKLEPEIFPAATDSRYLREKGYPAIGFSPMNHTPVLLHDHNEFLNEKIFLQGIPIYEKLVSALASMK